MKTERLRAIYYPYADFRDPGFALRAAVYYDELYHLQLGIFCPPGLSGSRAYPGRGDSLLHEDIVPLKEAGILREVEADFLGIDHIWMPGGTQVHDDENRELLIAGISADFRNETLRGLTKQCGKLSWSFPNMQFIGIAASGILFETAARLSQDIGIEYVTGHPIMREEAATFFKIVSPDRLEHRAARGAWDAESVLVPFHMGESLMINIALLAASRLTATPITDSGLHHQFLRGKFSGLGKNADLTRWLREHGLLRETQAAGLAEEVLKLRLPHIEPLTGERVLRIRAKCAEELNRFRAEMLRLATKMEVSPWEEDFAQEVKDTVASEVQPALLALEASLKKLERELAIKVVEKAISASPLALVTTLFAGLPVEIALAGAVGVGALLQTLDYLNQKKAVKANGLSFLLSM